MGVSIWWSFIDQYGTDRIRRFIAVDQPVGGRGGAVDDLRATAAESGAIFDVAALVGLGEGLHGPGGIEVRDGFVRSMFSGETDPDVLSFVLAELDTVPSYVGVPLLFDHCAQDWRDVLPRIDVPTLVIGCDGSHVDAVVTAPTSPSRSPTRACTSSRPTWPAPTSRSWRTRPRSTPWSRTSSTGNDQSLRKSARRFRHAPGGIGRRCAGDRGGPQRRAAYPGCTPGRRAEHT